MQSGILLNSCLNHKCARQMGMTGPEVEGEGTFWRLREKSLTAAEVGRGKLAKRRRRRRRRCEERGRLRGGR